MTYQAPVDDMMLALNTAGRLPDLLAAGLMDGLDEDTVRAILEEAGKLGSEVLDPLNRVGDKTGSRLVDGRVVTPPGWDDAYKQFVAGGWSALPCPADYGGQGLPSVVAMTVCEIWNSANMAFGMCPLLTNGAIDSIDIGGSNELKARYLPKMISGEWTGTMNLTEPQAGSDLNAVTTKAVKQSDGTYRITGTKIYISYGDHELSQNIIHLVLARLPDAPPGTRGISLFLVPKFLVNDDGSLGARNDVICAGLEHKLGIVASPTCVMKFGETGGAVGYLVGEENRGLKTMFIMMNAARLAVGIQGVAIAERATQRAVQFAQERRQGRAVSNHKTEMSPIIDHPDIRRTLLTMKALTKAARAICLATAAATDMAHRSGDEATRMAATNRVALLTPIAKAFATDVAVEVASLGIQVHGGMGFIEETGAAQYLRDARILPIYEGTNGIQAIDLVTRKIDLENGTVYQAFTDEIAVVATQVAAVNSVALGKLGERLRQSIDALQTATAWYSSTGAKNPEAALAGATPYLRLFSLVAGGRYLAEAALAALARGDHAAEDISLARFYADHILVGAAGLAECVVWGGDSVVAIGADGLP
jgi:acyl-CoA dehydrogenase